MAPSDAVEVNVDPSRTDKTVEEQFSDELREKLSQPLRTLIMAFTMKAKNLIPHAEAVVSALGTHLQASYEKKDTSANKAGWFLVDAVMKTTGTEYMQAFGVRVVRWVREFMAGDAKLVSTYRRMVDRWMQILPDIKGQLQEAIEAKEKEVDPENAPAPAPGDKDLPPSGPAPSAPSGTGTVVGASAGATIMALPSTATVAASEGPKVLTLSSVNPEAKLPVLKRALDIIHECRAGKGSRELLLKAQVFIETVSLIVTPEIRDLVFMLTDTAISCGDRPVARKMILDFLLEEHYDYATLQLVKQPSEWRIPPWVQPKD